MMPAITFFRILEWQKRHRAKCERSYTQAGFGTFRGFAPFGSRRVRPREVPRPARPRCLQDGGPGPDNGGLLDGPLA